MPDAHTYNAYREKEKEARIPNTGDTAKNCGEPGHLHLDRAGYLTLAVIRMENCRKIAAKAIFYSFQALARAAE